MEETLSKEFHSARHLAGERVAVLLPLPLAGCYDYRVPPGFELENGAFVTVPLGRRRIAGVVWGNGQPTVPEERLRDVLDRFDVPPLPEVSRRFVEWVARYTVHPPGSVLKMAMSVPAALSPPRTLVEYVLATSGEASGITMTPARRRVLDRLAAGSVIGASDLARDANVGTAVIRGLVDAGLIEARITTAEAALPNWHHPGPTLTTEQARAAERLRAAIDAGFSVSLLDGPPGSGKTEVYFEAVAAALARGLQVLVLLPEIALGAQWLERFRERFGALPAQWHSDLGQSYRRRVWRGVADGTMPLVVGARSALFLPYPRLGLIIVDEEHDTSYKQEDGVTYNARDMAVVRGRLGEIPVVLASATPSLESHLNARDGRYREVPLAARFGPAAPPAVELIDLKREPPPPGRWLSSRLGEALTATRERGEQALIFLNRRGYAPLTLCRTCGHRFNCPSCSAWLVEHRLIGRLQCHHCGYFRPTPDRCPACESRETLVACGPGIERIAEELTTTIPGVRLALATSDTLNGPRAAAELVRRIEDKDVDVIVGTQIMAKGYHFPGLTLVGVVDADLGLAGGDLRAGERTFQLLTQVSGRAGRGDRPGTTLIQTHYPDHPVIAALAGGDRTRFLAEEEAQRRTSLMPPFGRLAALIISGTAEDGVIRTARILRQAAPASDGVRVWGPAPAPLALLRGRHRHRLLVHSSTPASLSSFVRAWIASVDIPSNVRIQIDIDPVSFL